MYEELSPAQWALVKGIRRSSWRGVLEWTDRAGLAILAAVLLLLFPYLAGLGLIDQATVSQMGRYCCLAVLAVGLDLVWGYAGILSLCQALFFTLGGYALGMHLCMVGPQANGVPLALSYLSSDVGGAALPGFWKPFASFPFTVLAVALIPGAIAFGFGYLAFRSRIRGVYFSIITQALTVVGFLLFCRNDLRLCGTNGLTNFSQLLGASLAAPATKLALYEVSALLLIASVCFALWLTRTRFGRLLVAVRDSESRLRFAGYQPVWFKTAVFTIGAVMAGLGGALYAPQTGIITPSNLKAAESLMVVVWVAVGGRGTVVGAVVGALAINFLYSQLTSLVPKLWPFILGGLFVTVVLCLPDGLIGAWRRLLARVRGVHDV
jgi:urea transport system permease protein